MANETLLNYVSSERTRGLSDELIRAELLKAGWNGDDVTTALLSGAATSPSSSVPNTGFFSRDLSTIGLYFLLPGVLLFLIASSVLVTLQTSQGVRGSDEEKIMYGLFALAHMFNGLSAFFFFHSALRLSRALFYKAWVGLLATPVVLFAVSSFVHFVSLSGGADFSEILRGLLGDDELIVITYFVLLPLQPVVFLLLLITCWILRFRRRRVADQLLPSARLTTGLLIFFVMGVLALLDFFFMLEGVRF